MSQVNSHVGKGLTIGCYGALRGPVGRDHRAGWMREPGASATRCNTYATHRKTQVRVTVLAQR